MPARTQHTFNSQTPRPKSSTNSGHRWRASDFIELKEKFVKYYKFATPLFKNFSPKMSKCGYASLTEDSVSAAKQQPLGIKRYEESEEEYIRQLLRMSCSSQPNDNIDLFLRTLNYEYHPVRALPPITSTVIAEPIATPVVRLQPQLYQHPPNAIAMSNVPVDYYLICTGCELALVTGSTILTISHIENTMYHRRPRYQRKSRNSSTKQSCSRTSEFVFDRSTNSKRRNNLSSVCSVPPAIDQNNIQMQSSECVDSDCMPNQIASALLQREPHNNDSPQPLKLVIRRNMLDHLYEIIH